MNRTILFSPERVKQLVGVDISSEEAIMILDNLGFKIDKTSGILRVSVPSWRHDISREEDLVEEVIRIYGLDKIPLIPFDSSRYGSTDDENFARSDEQKGWISRRILAERGLIETLTWSFLSEDHANEFMGSGEKLRVENPISSDLNIMRSSLLPNLISGAVKNFARGQENSHLFEIGAQYIDSTPQGQELMASGIRTQAQPRKSWGDTHKPADIWAVKADALAIIEACGIQAHSLEIVSLTPQYYHPGKSAALCLGPKTILAYFGQMHPRLQKYYDFEPGIVMFEVFLSAIPILNMKRKIEELKVSPYQCVDRDFAFVVEEGVPVDKILKCIKRVDKSQIIEVSLFDVYQGTHIPTGKKSVAIGVRLQSQHKTLTDLEINAICDKIISEVEQVTGGVLRQ